MKFQKLIQCSTLAYFNTNRTAKINSCFYSVCCIAFRHGKKSSKPTSSTSGGGVAGRRGKRKRPPVEEDEEEDGESFMEGSEGGDRVMVEGREEFVNGLLKQLIKVWLTEYM